MKSLVIGSCLESALYSFLTGAYYLSTLKFGPVFYDTVSLRFLGNERKDYTWSRIQLYMALMGKLMAYSKIHNIRIDGDRVKLSTSDGFFKYKFQKCEIFDPTGIELENNIKDLRPLKYLVYDDFELSNLGAKHEWLQPKETQDSFARKIHYYVSSRVDGAKYVTDCVVESILTREQIHDFDYSDTMARFAVERHLSSIGVEGNFMKMYKNGTPKYRKPKVLHKERIVQERDQNHYEDSENVKFLNLTLKEIFDEFSTARP